MRIVRVRSPRSDRTVLWVATGAVVGLVTGIVVAERMSGRRPDWRRLAGRGRSLARTALASWGPLLEAARSLRDMWEERGGLARAFAEEPRRGGGRARARAAAPDEAAEGWDEDEELVDEVEADDDLEGTAEEDHEDPEDEDEEMDEDEQYEEDDDGDEDDEDDEDDEHDEHDEDDEDDEHDEGDEEFDDLDREEGDEEAEEEANALDARVLEAFVNDPILAHRAVEIIDLGEGRILLRGQVRSPREARRALTIAGGVPGVARVRERLTVRARSR